MKHIVSTVALFLIIVIALFCFNPIVISNWRFKNNAVIQQENFFENFDFENGKWKCYIINKDDDISPFVPKGKVLTTSDRLILKQLQTIEFSYSCGDIATIESKIYLYQDDKLYYCTSIWLGECRSGLQTSEFGWIEAKNPKSFCQIFKKFRRVYSPLVIL